MRARDVEDGQTYVVLVPHRLPASRYPDRDRPGSPMWVMSFLAGTRFRVTVTKVDFGAAPAAAEGVRFIERSHAEVLLTDEQVTALGLVPDRRYLVVGSLVEPNGRLAYLPATEPIRVPVRWLYSSDDPRAERPTYRDADRWPYM